MNIQLNIAIYCIDDDAGTRATLKALFKTNNILNYTIFSDPVKLLETLHKGVQVCIIDYDLKNEKFNGLTLMQAILLENAYCKCIIMSGHEEAFLIKDFLNNGGASLFAAVKGVAAWKKEETKQTEIEEIERTKRAEIEAKENSLGKEALIMLRAEIVDLQKAKNESTIKIDKIETIIQRMEITYDFIQRRMMSMFSNDK
jgi:DNA-binding NtrC family response regulator